MRDIVEFLQSVESKAFDVYSGAADFFANNGRLSEFIFKLAEDEALHFHLMSSALSLLESIDEDVREHISLDRETKERIAKPLDECAKLLKSESLTKEVLLKNMVDAEFSEWNYIFLYVIGRLKEKSPIFSFAASKIQAHQKRVEKFLEIQKGTNQLIETIRKTPKLWDKKVLIIDDEVALLNLLKAVLSDEFEVDIAENGMEGLKKIEESYYDAVISDIDMPIMDGVELFKDVLKNNPQQAGVFAFATGYSTDERANFARKNGITLYEKPYTFDQIRDFIHQCVEK